VNIENAISRIEEIGIVPVVRAANLDEARKAVDAIYAGGIPLIEITLTVPNAPAMIQELVKHYGTSVLTGLGLGVGKEPLAEIENRQRARDTGRSAGGNDGKVPVEHDD